LKGHRITRSNYVAGLDIKKALEVKWRVIFKIICRKFLGMYFILIVSCVFEIFVNCGLAITTAVVIAFNIPTIFLRKY